MSAAPEMMLSRRSSRLGRYLCSSYVRGLIMIWSSKSSRAAASSPVPSKVEMPVVTWGQDVLECCP